MTRGPTYGLTLTARPDPAPAVVRLRRALKVLLRVHGLRCVAAREFSPGTDSPRLRMTPAPLAAELAALAVEVDALLQAAEADLPPDVCAEAAQVLLDVLGRLDGLAVVLAAAIPR